MPPDRLTKIGSFGTSLRQTLKSDGCHVVKKREPVPIKKSQMTSYISPSIYYNSGYRDFNADEEIKAVFHHVIIYSIQGIKIENALFRAKGNLSSHDFEIAIGDSIIRINEDLFAKKLIEDEKAWEKERKCRPPYAVFHYGPTKEYIATGKYIRIEDTKIHTHEAFGEAAKDMRALIAEIHPSAVTSLECSLSAMRPPDTLESCLVPICEQFLGLTDDGRTVDDRIFVADQVTAYLSVQPTLDLVQHALDTATVGVESPGVKASRFYYLAMNETDVLKQFLYFFLAIEVWTHRSFKTIDHQLGVNNSLQLESRIQKSASSLFESRSREFRNLKDRFIWCAVCVWPQIDDRDIELFCRLKKTRDGIAHGMISEPKKHEAREAKMLATKLFKTLDRSE